jgi:oligosaccharide repeat unit polymerase
MEDGTLDAPDSAQMEPIAPGVKNPFLATALKKTSTLYLYTTGSYAGFGLWYPPPGPLTWGLNCAYPAVRLLNRAGLLSRQPPLQVPGFTKVVRRGNAAIFFNGYTFLYYPIRDFGLVGMVAYCLLTGFLVGTVYERLRRVRSSSIHLLLMAQISIGLVLSIFVNKFNNTTSWYLAVVTTAPFWLTAVAHRVAGRREPLVREAALDGK